MKLHKLALLVVLSIIGISSSAAAQSEGSANDKKISAALLLGYGVSLEGGGNIYGLGFGARGGYNITDSIYLGGRFQYHLGFSNDIGGVSAGANLFLVGVEGGYDLHVAKQVTVRPEVGLGLAVTSVDFVLPGILGGGVNSASSTDLYISFGGALLYDVSDSVFIGAHVDLPIVLAGGSAAGLTFLATAGMRF